MLNKEELKRKWDIRKKYPNKPVLPPLEKRGRDLSRFDDMAHIDRNYYRRKFDTWRNKVISRIPHISADLFARFPNPSRELLKQYGSMVRDLANPFYGITDHVGDLIPENEFICFEILLKIQVESVMSQIYKK